MLAADRASPGHNLMSALRAARRSWWGRALVDGLLVAVIAGAAATLVVWVRAWWLGEAGGLLGSGAAARASLAAAAGAFVSWLGVASARSPSPLELARRVDVLLGQSERFSTTYEVLASGGPHNVVARALLAEVEERAAALHAAPAGWARRSRWLVRAASVALPICALLLAVPVPSRAARGAAVAMPAAPAVRDAAADADTLSRAAELLDLVAQQEDSDYLRAVAASFADLAARVSSHAVSDADASAAAQELAEHLRAAAQDVGGAFASAVEAALAPDPASAGPEPTQLGGAAPSPAPAGAAPSGEPSSAADAQDTVADPSAAFYTSLGALVDRFEADPSAVGVRPQLSAQADADAEASFYGGVLNAVTDPNAAPPQQPGLGRVEGGAAGAPVGAAQRSSDAPGDAAGQGAADFGPGSDAFLDLAAAGASVDALPRNQRDDGRFVEMELVPQADAAAAPSATAQEPPAFVRSEEAAFAFRGIGAEHAGVVSRYFTPGSLPGADGR